MWIIFVVLSIWGGALTANAEGRLKSEKEVAHIIKNNRTFGGHLTFGWNRNSYEEFRKVFNDDDLPLLFQMYGEPEHREIQIGIGMAIEGRCEAATKVYREKFKGYKYSEPVFEVSQNRDCSEAARREAKDVLDAERQEKEIQNKNQQEEDKAQLKQRNETELKKIMGK